MEHEMIWGMPVVLYLFLAGVGAGGLVTSASLILRGGPNQTYFRFAKYGAWISVPLVGIGTAFLVLELGSFQAGHWFRFINLYKVMNLSPMSVGSWFLLLYFAFAAVYTWLFLIKGASPNDKYQPNRRLLAWFCLPLGIGVAVYTGVLLGAMPSRPLWNSPILAMLFLVSAISTGIATVMLMDWVFNALGLTSEPDKERHTETCYLLASTDTLLIGFEMAVILLFFMYAHLTVGDHKTAIAVFESGGEYSSIFWIGVFVVGLAIPLVVELFKVMPKLLRHETYQHSGLAIWAVPLLVVFGGLILRYAIVFGGQVARLAGI